MSKIVRHTANGNDWLLVDVPKGAVNFCLANDSLCYQVEVTFGFYDFEIELPPGKYQFQFLASGATEEQAAEVVEWYDSPTGGDDYRTYTRNYEGSQEPADWPWFNEDWLKSLQSLTRSHGFTEDVAVIKIIN